MGPKAIRNKAEELKGQLKEKLGELTDNKDLQAEGAFEKSKARGKQAVEQVKDHISDATRDARNGRN